MRQQSSEHILWEAGGEAGTRNRCELIAAEGDRDVAALEAYSLLALLPGAPKQGP